MSSSSKLNAWFYIVLPTRMTECNHQALSGAAVRATADMWLLNKTESICKRKLLLLLLLLQQTKTAKFRNFVILYHFKRVTSLKFYTLYGKTVFFEDIHYILQYTAVQYLFYRQYTVRVRSPFTYNVPGVHMEEFTLSSTTQQINKPRPGQPLTTASAPPAVDTPQVSICTRWQKPHSDSHTHTVNQHSPSAGVSGCTLEELTCDPELLLPWSRFFRFFFSAITLPLSSPPLVECTWRAD